MPSPLVARSLTFLLLIALIGCDQTPGTTDSTLPDGTRTSSARATKAAGDAPPLASIQRFDLDVNVEGDLTPNSPTRITLNVRAHVPTEKADIKLLLPEIHAARAAEARYGHRQVIDLPIGTPLPPSLHEEASIAEGETVRLSHLVNIKEPGYYMLAAVVRAPEEEVMTRDGRMIDNADREYLWLWIDEDGGRVTAEFDNSLFPDWAYQVAGPLTRQSEAPRMRPVQPGNESANSNVTGKSSSNKVTFYFTYLDPKTDELVPVSSRPVYYVQEDQYTGEILAQGWSRTDTGGEWSRSCDPMGYESIDVELHTRGDVDVIWQGTNTVAGSTFTSLAACGHTIEKRVNGSMVYVLEEMTKAVQRGESHFAPYARGGLTVDLRNDQDRSFYRPNEDRIYLADERYDGGQQWDDFIIHHEWGHAFHEKALGGNEGGNCPSRHYLNGPHNLQCAFSEGFANYYAAETVDEDNRYKTRFENNIYYPGKRYYDDDGDEDDGSLIEGAVAAFLYDLTDPANETHDAVHYDGGYVGAIIKTCRVQGSGFDRRANGVDDLIACFQRELPDYTTYFPTRASLPYAYSEAATEPSSWNRDDIEALWLHNLYEHYDAGKSLALSN